MSIHKIGETHRMCAMYICDLYAETADGREELTTRKFYDTSAPAKGYRTMMVKKLNADLQPSIYGDPPPIYIGPYLEYPDVPDPANQIVLWRADVYMLTPIGYEDIP